MMIFGTLYRMKEEASFIKSVFCIWYGYAWVSSLADASQLISLAILGLKLEDAFNAPYLADSFTDFWARRWNLLVAAQLRELCYEPIVQGSVDTLYTKIHSLFFRKVDRTKAVLSEEESATC